MSVTKSSLCFDNLRSGESDKIDCVRAHYRAIEVAKNPARYTKAGAWKTCWGRCNWIWSVAEMFGPISRLPPVEAEVYYYATIGSTTKV